MRTKFVLASLLQAQHIAIDRALSRSDLFCEHRLHEAVALLRTHIGVEETMIYPLFRSSGYGAAITALALEHQDLLCDLLRLEGYFQARDEAGFDVAMTTLLNQLDAHNHKEETIIYDRVDELMIGHRKDELSIQLHMIRD